MPRFLTVCAEFPHPLFQVFGWILGIRPGATITHLGGFYCVRPFTLQENVAPQQPAFHV